MIKHGFQTYTWQMSYAKYAGRMEHIADMAVKGGVQAVEAEICMLKDYFDCPAELHRVFSERNIDFGGLCLVCNWQSSNETEEEKALADKAIKFAGYFGNTVLVLCQMPQTDRNDLAERQSAALACINRIARRAYDAGVTCAFHANSPAGSVFRTYEDYKLMLDRLDSRYIGFAPDSGHIIKGGMDVYDIFRDYISVIRHVHYKDIDENGAWCVMGGGITDFSRLTDILRSGGYDGYIMIEDESHEAEDDPDAVAMLNARYIAGY